MADSIKYQKRIRLPFSAPAINFLECYFESVLSGGQADVFACLFRGAPVPDWRSYEGLTRLIDLRCELDELFAGLTKGTRYEINRARKSDGVETSVVSRPTEMQLEEYMDYYDQFAASKRVPTIHRAQVQALGVARKIALSFARRADGVVLASHAYIFNHARARLTHSASLFRLEQESAERAQIGRANRLLHWSDLVTFRAMGKQWYDLGGWYGGSHDEALLKINAFKKEFGGEVVKEWNSFDSGSKLGSLYLALRDLKLRRKAE
jgi:lipid II:glycine glycyltransferase (peptidoglycan interpeptide bridge formation enzyme)